MNTTASSGTHGQSGLPVGWWRGPTLAWALASLLLLLFRGGYPFPRFDVLDSWIYSAYQWDLRGQIADFGSTYYGSRMSWIIPGALCKAWLPLGVGQILFKLLVSSSFALACAAIVRRSSDATAAVLAATLAVATPEVVASIQSDYIDPAVFVNAALAIACITLARESRRWVWWILVAGVFFTNMAIANLSAIASIGAGVAVYHLVWLGWSVRRHAVSILVYLSAVALTLAFWASIHKFLGGRFFFIQPQLDMLVYMRDLADNPWVPRNPRWFMEATWLVIPVGVLLWGMAVSGVSPPADVDRRRQLLALTGGLLTSLSLAWVMQGAELNGTLNFDFYASFHLALALPLLAMLVDPGGSSRALGLVLLAVAPAIVLFWPPWLLSDLLQGTLPFAPTPQSVHVVLACGLLAAAGSGCLVRMLPREQEKVRRLLNAGLLVGLLVTSMPPSFGDPTRTDRLGERYVAVHDAYEVVAREFPMGGYRYWHDPSNPNSKPLSSTKLWGIRLFSPEPFPRFQPEDFARIGSDTFIIVPGSPGTGNEVLAQAETAVAKAGYALSESNTIATTRESGIGFDLVAFRVVHVSPQADETPE